ncbi:MAG: carboxypeptidase regulatory-like domain-containing protein [Nitrospiraceae bacterium]|nr:carboxypeptidase regulatory-like domain-containing protein [Nitrospiraceae bacterium]
MKQSRIIWAAAMAAGLATVVGVGSGEAAYEPGTVTEGATVRGTVSLKGSLPEPKQFELRRYPDRTFCGTLSNGEGLRQMTEVTVGQEGGLKDVVIVIEGVQHGKPFDAQEATVEARTCQFLPYVTVVSEKRQLTVTNRDPVSHDIQGYTYDQSGVDIVLHRPSLKATGTTETVHLVKGRKVFTMQCGVHPYMQNWGYAVDNPNYAVTATDGAFAIADLPAGTYKVKAWHPTLGELARDLIVEPNRTVQLDLEFNAK